MGRVRKPVPWDFMNVLSIMERWSSSLACEVNEAEAFLIGLV
jgi:hypothetical protein